ncbi:cell division protein ZapA [Candidatus Aerophobetes bacterium]|uniref:Cell division protein ZapA n=1 Tax=Aerophobetes bacterium TaxID=2030807 RepID=A0A662DGX7_UNCAE|nr:cell division protein ZapA [Candidatus Aerophobetes bacterium]RLE15040.1 MAG: cell division protein ZapA [Candidatus Aerophobetes bacterium]
MGVKVTIYNREYNLKSDSEEDEYSLRQIAAYVDERIREIASSTPDKSFDQICVLACLNLAAEIFSLKQKNLKAKQKLKQLLDKLTIKVP